MTSKNNFVNSSIITDLICDKNKEPPCHLKPSIKLCKKCELNKDTYKEVV